jgi:hypothetical protein
MRDLVTRPITWVCPRGIGLKLALLVLSGVVGLAMAELLLRMINPTGGFFAARELSWLRPGGPGDRASYVLDPSFGFRPSLGNDVVSEYGTLVNGYDIEKWPGCERLLFVGDSVTFRGKIIDALEGLYGRDRFEYWNAGVDSFNTIQEVRYYKEYNARIRPDHVILGFHNNDFETTPVAFEHRGGPVVYAPNRPLSEISPWLFRHSKIYRLWAGFGLRPGPNDAIVAETEAKLLELKQLLKQSSIRLSILLLPVFVVETEWSVRERRSREHALRIFREHGFRYFDLVDSMNEALRDGVDVQEFPGDRWHPSADCAKYFAQYLHGAGLLDDRIADDVPPGS